MFPASYFGGAYLPPNYFPNLSNLLELGGFDLADGRSLPVLLFEPTCPLLYDEQTYPVCYDSTHLKTLFMSASAPVIYGQFP